MGGFLEARDIHKSFGSTAVLKGVSLTLDPGEIIMLIGSSGSGKSTLLRCLNGLETVDSGEVLIKGVQIQGRTPESMTARASLGMVFQGFNLFPHMTALENVANPLRVVRRMPKEEAESAARARLGKVHLAEFVDRYPAQLSGGQKQRVAIARALAMEPQAMLFDEPTSALDPELAFEVLDTIRELAAEGLAMVIATHQVNFVGGFAHRIVFLDEGRVRVEGSPEHVLSESKDERLCRFLGHLRENT